MKKGKSKWLRWPIWTSLTLLECCEHYIMIACILVFIAIEGFKKENKEKKKSKEIEKRSKIGREGSRLALAI